MAAAVIVQRLTRFVLRHKRFVVLGWLLLGIAGAATASHTIGQLTDSYAMPGQQSYTVNNQIVKLYGNGGAQEPIVPVVTVPAGESVRDRGVRQRLNAVFDAARANSGIRIVDYATTGSEAFVTDDGRSTFALVFTPPNEKQNGLSSLDKSIARRVMSAAPPGWTVHVTGMRELTNFSPDKKGNGVVAESMIGALGAVVILLLVFGSLLVLLPLVVAIISILTTFLLLGGLAAATDVSFVVEYLVALIGLGVAIDYSLLVLTRWREERDIEGTSAEAAVTTAMAHAGRSVAFSGMTVAIGLLALVVLRVPFLTSIGYAGVLIPLVSVAVAVTLLPVLLATVGARLECPRRRHEAAASRRWLQWARMVERHRVVAAVVGVAILAALAVPVLSLHLGEPRTSTLATTGAAREGLDTLTAGGVPSGVLTPMEVLTRGTSDVTSRLAGLPGVDAVLAPQGAAYHRGGTSIVDVLPVAEAGQSAGKVTVSKVRAAVADDPAVSGVGGVGPETVDAVNAIYGHFPLMLTLIAVVTFLLLARAVRSVALAVKALVVNFLSVAAAYGVLVLVWQWGHGSNAVWGVQSTGTVTFWVPVFVFAFLFGLSMDYEVFILTRIREAYDRTGSTSQATVEGLARTGRLVTCAALILAFAFVAMSTGPQTDLKIMATGLGAGIIIDAVVVRTLLVPALVSLLGRWNWWLPVPLAGLLRVPPSPAVREPIAPATALPNQDGEPHRSRAVERQGSRATSKS